MRQTLSQCFVHFPARYVFVLLTSIALFLVYAFKGFLGVAIVAMVANDSHNQTSGNECPAQTSINSNETSPKGQFDWDDKEQAIVLGAFFYGYVITQIPFGIATEYLSTKWMFGSSMLVSSLLSVLGPIAAHWGFVPFLVTRLGQGLAQGAILPCMNMMIARWMPKMERSRAVALIMFGSSIGSVVTLPLTGYLCDEPDLGGWPTIFYLLGVAGSLWFVLWALFMYDSPEKHPFISQKEVQLISEGQGNEKMSSSTRRRIPWKSMVSSYQVYACIVAHFGYNWGYLTILTLMPTYFTKILHMDVKTNGLVSSLPYIAMALMSSLASYITDKLRAKGISITLLRKINNSIAFFGTGLCMVGVILSECDKTLSVVFFVLGLGLNGCCYPGFLANYVDMAPDFAGILMGFANSFGNTPGFAAPYVAAVFYSEGQTLKNWSHVFYICIAVYFFTQIIYLLFTTSELQPWGLNQTDKSEHSEQGECDRCDRNVESEQTIVSDRHYQTADSKITLVAIKSLDYQAFD